jgi:hypothetical protein
MRMCEYDYSNSYWVNLFNEMYEKGIVIHHVSNEYESFKFYSNVLNKFYDVYPKKRIKHIVKLAEPHFDSNFFDPELLMLKINDYRQALQVEKELFGIQWMWRGSLSDDVFRCKQFEKSGIQIKDYISLLKRNRLIGKFYIFPYSISFAKAVLKFENSYSGFFDGFIVYRNFMELEFDSILNESNKSNLVLRPLNAGKTLNVKNAKDSFEFALSHKNVSAGIISISSVDKLNEIYDF